MVDKTARRSQAPSDLMCKTVNPLVSAVKSTFRNMLSVEARRDRLDIRPEDPDMFDISAIIGVTGRVSGSFCISFPFETAGAAVSRFTGMDVAPNSSLAIDGVGEFTNVIVGNAKDQFEIALNLGIPNVVVGQDHHISFPPETYPMRLMFTSEIGPLLIDFGFSSQVY